jgi:general secretion pathway protein H
LLELLVVLAVASLMAAVAAPFTVRTIERAELRADAREMTSDLRALRQRAIDGRRAISVAALSETLWPESGRAVRHRAIFVGEDGGTALVFYPDGTSSGGTFRLQDGNHVALMRVAWLSGAVSAEQSQERTRGRLHDPGSARRVRDPCCRPLRVYEAGGISLHLIGESSDTKRFAMLAQSKLDEIAAIRTPPPPTSKGAFSGSDVTWRIDAHDLPHLKAGSSSLRLQSVRLTLSRPGGRPLSVETRHLGTDRHD